MAITIEMLTAGNEAMLLRLCQKLGYSFNELRHLQKALIHKSFSFEQGATGEDYETLEFLGDAVLDLAVGFALFKRFPDMKEGELTRNRASLVNENALAKKAQELGLGSYLLLGKGEEASDGRGKNSILSCAYEAVAGAIFLDGGYEKVQQFVETHFEPHFSLQQTGELFVDAKSKLQESLQEKYSEAPEYTIDKEEGPAHEKLFTASVSFRGKRLGSGTAGSKKEAEQIAASPALIEIENIDF